MAANAPLETIDLQLRWLPQFQFAGYYAAVENGYYREEGLDVRIHPGAPDRQPVAEVLTGRAQYAEGNSEVLLARLQGQPLVALAAIFQHSPSVLLALRQSGIASAHDLVGKKVMFMGSKNDPDFLTMLLNEGISPDQLTVLPSSFNFEDLVTGKVDAFNSYLTNEPFLLKQRNIEYTVINPRNYRVDFYSDILFTTEAEVREHPRRVEAMRRATLKGWRYAMDHPDEVISLLIDKYQVKKSRQHLKFEAETMHGLILPDLIEIGHMNPERWRHMAETFARTGVSGDGASLDGFIYEDPRHKRLPGWVVPVMIAAALLLVLITLVAAYFVRINRRLAAAERTLVADIAERQQMEAALRESDQRHRTLIEWSPEPIGVHRGGKLVYANPATVRMLGAESVEDLIGKPILDFVHPDFHQVVLERAKVAADTKLATPIIQEQFLKLDGSVIDVEVQSIAIDYDGEPAIQVAMRDVTERKAAADEIRHLAFYDPLTDLPNRRLMLDRLARALTSTARHGRWGALMLIDLDNFKTLNDTLGHSVGDQLLVEVAARLQSGIREGDTVARLGGDEFVVILEDLDAGELAAVQAEGVATKILAKLGQAYRLDVIVDGEGPDKRYHHCTSSIGLTLFRGPSVTVDELMKRADTAMYQAKAAGRNTLRFFDPEMQAVVKARATLELDLRTAVIESQFVLHYQAQIDSSGQVIGAEALVRWQHPERGLVPPAEFIPLAEETGLILPLGHWVMEKACAQLAAWARKPETAHLTLAVNVSARQFSLPNLVEQVLAVVDYAGARPSRLKLELTESLLLENAEDIIAKMIALKARGVGFSLDDFGTGYSSLSYLKRLPLDQLKIDQSFVRDVLTDPNDAAIARTVVALGQSLGLSVIAEGVETLGQRDFLASHGCLNYQGYFFSRPLPLDEFEAFLKPVPGAA